MQQPKRMIPELFVILFVIMALAGGKAYAQVSYAPPNDAPNPYQAAQTFGQLPNGRTFSPFTGIYVGPDDNIWVFDRCGGKCDDSDVVDPIMEFDKSGKLLRSIGAGLFSHPHGLYVDREGNVWATDQPGRVRGQQVFKLSPEGKVLMKLGKATDAGDDPMAITEPNAVVVAPNGDIFVADGHSPSCGTSRILKFTKDGKFIKVFGHKGNGPTDVMCPHDLAMDSKGRLFVADMGNKRVDIFDQQGKFITSWKQFGRPTAMFIDTHDVLYVADTASNDQHVPIMADALYDYTYNPGVNRGIRFGSVKDGKTIAYIPDPHPGGQTSMGEGVTADREGNLYQAPDSYNKNVKKYVKK